VTRNDDDNNNNNNNNNGSRREVVPRKIKPVVREHNNNNNNNTCRLYKEYEEIINHQTSGCPNLAKNEYVIRRDKVCTHLHYLICRKLGIETTEN
jgi:hypothetical protein